MRELVFSIILLTSTFFHTQFKMQLIAHRAEISRVIYPCKNPEFTFTKKQEYKNGIIYHKASFSFSPGLVNQWTERAYKPTWEATVMELS